MLPRKLYNFNVIIDGRPQAGVAEEMTLPSLDRKMEDYRGAGMLGPVSLDLGMEGLKIEFVLAQFDQDVLQSWGAFDASGINTRFLGAARADGGDTRVEAIEISCRGRWKKIDYGSAKAGDLAKMKVEMPLTYLRYTSNGNQLVEIDLISGKEVVGGVDRSADVMRALGMAT